MMTLSKIYSSYRKMLYNAKRESIFWYRLSNGYKFKIDKNNYGDLEYFTGESNSTLVNIINKYVSDGDYCLDIGAQKGYVSLHLIGRVGKKGKIYAFEPDPRSREFLNEVLHVNHITNCEIMPYALGDENSRHKFELTKTLGWSSIYPNELAKSDFEKEIEVEIRKLEDIISANEFEKIKFIKIDCEGSELFVLKGMEDLLCKHKPIMWIEINKPSLAISGTRPDDIFSFLSKYNYNIYLSDLVRSGIRKEVSIKKVNDLNSHDKDCYDILAK